MRRAITFALSTLSLCGLVSALGTACSVALSPSAAATDPYWLAGITHQGISAFNANPSTYTVFRNVKNYGAKGDGVTDDTAAINSAITAGSRCGSGCASSTLTPALVYFPPGTYIVSTPIVALYYTALVGDKKTPPTLKASAGFSGIAVIDADPYLAGGANLYTNQNNFFRTVRNFVIDTTAMCATCGGTGLHWQVAQATSLVNVVVNLSQASGNTHQGIFMENGSGGLMSDLVFNGGKFGVWLGNQQFTVRNITVNNAAIAIHNQWNWGWTYQGVTINNCGVGFEVATDGLSDSPVAQTVGADSIIDVTVTNTPIFLKTTSNQPTSLSGSILLENIVATNVPVIVSAPSGTVLAGSTGSITIPQWMQGNIYSGSGSTAKYYQGTLTKPTKPATLTANGKVFGRSRPQYEQYAISQFVSVRTQGAKGDGVTDDTAALQAVFNKYSGCAIIFVDAGTYKVTSTLKIPAGTQMVGELWSNIQASGSYFASATNPKVLAQVGNAGDTGRTEISDIVFTGVSGSAGAIMVEWNVADASGQQGSAAMWDVHFRHGGYTGSGIQESNCAKLSGHAVAPCTAAYLSLHLTKTSSAYLENVWLWTADHDLDAADQGQIDVYAGRGMLIESQGPVWLLGTAAEHHTIYQYNIANAANVYIALIQTETPYYQPSPVVPSPFTLNTTLHDPTFPSGQQSAWALNIVGSTEVFAYGVNLYSFFQNYAQTCGTTFSCQPGIFQIDTASTKIYIYNLNTVWTTYQVWYNGAGTVNQASNSNGFSSTVGFWTSSDTGALPAAASPKGARSDDALFAPGVHIHRHIPIPDKRAIDEDLISRTLQEMHGYDSVVARNEVPGLVSRTLQEMHGSRSAKRQVAGDLEGEKRSDGLTDATLAARSLIHSSTHNLKRQVAGGLDDSAATAKRSLPRGATDATLAARGVTHSSLHEMKRQVSGGLDNPILTSRTLQEMHSANSAKRAVVDDSTDATLAARALFHGAPTWMKRQVAGDLDGSKPNTARRSEGENPALFSRTLHDMHHHNPKRATRRSLEDAFHPLINRGQGQSDAHVVERRSLEEGVGHTKVPRNHGQSSVHTVERRGIFDQRSEISMNVPRGHGQSSVATVQRRSSNMLHEKRGAPVNVPRGHGQSSVHVVERSSLSDIEKREVPQATRDIRVPQGHGQGSAHIVARRDVTDASVNVPRGHGQSSVYTVERRGFTETEKRDVSDSPNVPRGHGQSSVHTVERRSVSESLKVPRALQEMHDSHVKENKRIVPPGHGLPYARRTFHDAL